MEREQYMMLKKAFIGLKNTHIKARIKGDFDFQKLNYYANIIENMQPLFKDFEEVKIFILKEIGEVQ